MNKLPQTIARTLVFLGLLLALCFDGKAQERFSIKTANGYLFVQNSSEKSFTLEFNGKSIEPKTAGENPTFIVDGQLVQIVWVETKNFVTAGKTPAETQTLELHRGWEVDYLAGVYEQKLTPVSETQTIAGQTALSWYFVRPKFKVEYDRDVFLTIVVGKNVIGLSSPLRLADKLDDGRAVLARILKTINISDKPFDMKKLSDAAKAGNVGTR